MDQKDKITKALNDLSPERLKKLQELAMSQLSESQRTSFIFESLRDMKCRELVRKYCK